MVGLTAIALTAAGPAARADHIKTGGDLRVAVNLLLAEHVHLAAAATGWAMMGMKKQFEAAAGGLDANSVALAGAIGLVYGDGAKEAFLPLWRRHIGFFVDYTTATIRQDAAGRRKAVDELMRYAEDFGAFLNAANPNLPVEAVAALVREHAVTLTAAIDAQANQDWPKAYELQRKAAAHMQMISDALAGAIVKQFPDRFGS
ncbi:MAG: hypothetical protein D6686_16965 [Alphaproteobacteria bacterium]|nr:MAG: hypothetical protein D6686_16965 [Alphaproteobacteria bacterium]